VSTIFTVDLTTFAYGGESLGRLPDGRAIFVPFTFPGETVRVRLIEEKAGYARGELLEVIHASPDRITPRCIHYTLCGGCHYQHIPYERQLIVKTDILRDQLERIAHMQALTVEPCVPSPNPYYYRNHVQFHLTEQGKLGYQQMRSTRTFAVQECHLPEEGLNQLWPQLDFDPWPGLDRIHLRQGVEDDTILVLESSEDRPPEISIEDLTLSVVHRGPSGNQVLAGSEYVVIEVLGHDFRVSAGSFFQVNTPQATAMISHLTEQLQVNSSDTVLDIYAGVGFFSAFLAPLAERLIAIESSENACEDFTINLNEFDNVELYQATAEEVLPELDVHPQVVIVDPPRSGVSRQAMDSILALSPEILAYISCDPATLARDARRLIEDGYFLKQITPFDLFPQTYHIESISFWAKH
jgi:23S rRNA (uracil1939-C5)-methyltransferase